MTVRTATLATGSTGAANVTVTPYTCPSGKTAIIKTIHCSQAGGTAVLTIVAVASGAAIVNLFVGTIAVNGVLSLTEPYIVLEPGHQLLINANQTNAVKYWISGVELQGLAP